MQERIMDGKTYFGLESAYKNSTLLYKEAMARQTTNPMRLNPTTIVEITPKEESFRLIRYDVDSIKEEVKRVFGCEPQFTKDDLPRESVRYRSRSRIFFNLMTDETTTHEEEMAYHYANYLINAGTQSHKKNVQLFASRLSQEDICCRLNDYLIHHLFDPETCQKEEVVRTYIPVIDAEIKYRLYCEGCGESTELYTFNTILSLDMSRDCSASYSYPQRLREGETFEMGLERMLKDGIKGFYLDISGLNEILSCHRLAIVDELFHQHEYPQYPFIPEVQMRDYDYQPGEVNCSCGVNSKISHARIIVRNFDQEKSQNAEVALYEDLTQEALDLCDLTPKEQAKIDPDLAKSGFQMVRGDVRFEIDDDLNVMAHIQPLLVDIYLKDIHKPTTYEWDEDMEMWKKSTRTKARTTSVLKEKRELSDVIFVFHHIRKKPIWRVRKIKRMPSPSMDLGTPFNRNFSTLREKQSYAYRLGITHLVMFHLESRMALPGQVLGFRTIPKLIQAYIKEIKETPALELVVKMIPYNGAHTTVNYLASINKKDGSDDYKAANLFFVDKQATNFYDAIGVKRGILKRHLEIRKENDPYCLLDLEDIVKLRAFDYIHPIQPNDLEAINYLLTSLNYYQTPLKWLLERGYEYRRLQRYIEDMDLYECLAHHEVITFLKDYTAMCEDMGLPIELYPRNLRIRHDLMARNYNFQKDQLLNEKVKQVSDDNQEFFFEDENYQIVFPQSADDIVREGEIMHHCVASYVKSVSEKSTLILFARHKADLEKPLVTIEIQDGQIVQAKAKRNQHINTCGDQFMTFFKNFKAYVPEAYRAQIQAGKVTLF